MTEYKSTRIIDGKPRQIIVDRYGNIVNRNPSKEELDGLEKEPYAGKYLDRRYGSQQYTDEELLDKLRLFEKKEGRPPTCDDFSNNPIYPSIRPYITRFGNWINALIKAGLNVDLMGPQGSSYRGRQIEIDVLNHLEDKPIDLSGKNWHSYCDAIDPNDGPYDVKSSKLHRYTFYLFTTINKDKDDDKEAIQWYYFIALDDDSTIKYVWKVPGEIVEKNYFQIGLNLGYEFNIENMKKYDVTAIYQRLINDTKSFINRSN